MDDQTQDFLDQFEALPRGYSEGLYRGRRYGLTVRVSSDGRRAWLFAEELGGTGFVSCNIYRTDNGKVLLRPCEMPLRSVRLFVASYRPDR